MYNPTISLIISFFALLMFSSSYFFKKKSAYLMFQCFGSSCLAFSYLFIEQYLAMLAVLIGSVRTVIYYSYEKKGSSAPNYIVILVCVITTANYFVVNRITGVDSTVEDVLIILSYCLYAIVFNIRNLNLVRYAIIAPHVLAIIYNVVVSAPIFSTISFSVELTVTIVSIIYFKLKKDKKALY